MNQNPFVFTFPARFKLLVSILTLFFVLSVFSVYIFRQAQDVGHTIERQHRLMQNQNSLHTVRSQLSALRFSYIKSALDSYAGMEDSQRLAASLLQTDIGKLEKFAPETAKTIRSQLDQAQSFYDKSVKEYELGHHAESRKALDDALEQFSNLRMLIETASAELNAEAAFLEKLSNSLSTDLSSGPLWTLFASLAAVLALSAAMAFDVFIPMKKVTDKVIAASKNIENAEYYLFEVTRGDEIGEAEQALNLLLRQVSQGIRDIRETGTIARERLIAIEAADDGIGIVDTTGNLTYMNRALMQLHGIEGKDLPLYLGQPWEKLYSAKGQEHIRNVVLPTLHRKGFWRGESPIVRKTGEVIYADMSLTLLEGGGFIGTARDITERKRVEAEKEQLHHQFIQAQKMEAVGQLTGGVAHDFNNMLTIIDGNLGMLDDYVRDLPAIEPFLTAARNGVGRCTELTQRLLAFSRKQVLKPQARSINELVHSSAKLIARAVGETVELIISPAEELWDARIDAGQFENALLNLSINARDAMPDGGVLTIRTENRILARKDIPAGSEMAEGDYVAVSVSDTGSGIPPDVLTRVFDPFFTTKEVGKGSGLGLSMVYGFTRQSGGTTTIESTVGKGTTLTLYFPRVQEERAAVQEHAPQKSAALPHGHETVMVVEDQPELLSFLIEVLTRLKYKVHSARSGAQAIMLMDQIDHLDLLITDVVMPGGVDGIELAGEILEHYPDAKALYISGYPQHAADLQSKLKDNMEFLQKPFTREALAKKIRDVLES